MAEMDADVAAEVAHVRFPPGLGHVLVPTRPASAAALGVTLYTASRPRALAAQRALWLAVRAGALARLPVRRERWQPPMTDDVLAALCAEWRRAVGGPPAGLALYNRPQVHRAALTVLVCAGARSLLVRVRQDPDSLRVERRISEQAQALGGTAFRVPRLRAAGCVDGWHWVGYEVMNRRPHAAVRSTDPEVFEQIGALVEATVPRPPDCPRGWHGAHGDLAPWNFRRVGLDRWLIDWEDARYAPAGADEVYWAVTRAAMLRKSTVRDPGLLDRYAESRAYWHSQVSSRERDGHDVALIDRMLALLAPPTGTPAANR